MDVSPDLLPLVRVGSIAESKATRWLIESLWLEGACGIIGGQPKCCKSWLGLDMAVSVASGTPCLGRFPVVTAGSALVYMAEDRVEEVRDRIYGIARHRDLDFSSLDVTLITSPVVRLDTEVDQKRLAATVEHVRPRFLLLDPLVRLHRLDENNAREISGLLGFLREIERRFDVAIAIAHHASKRAHSRPGQGLRGSSDLHAFGDSNLYLARRDNDVELTVEHRSASSIDALRLRLITAGNSVHLEPTSGSEPPLSPAAISDRVVAHLAKTSQPVSRNTLREVLKVNNQRLCLAINQLCAASVITSGPTGLRLSITP